MATGVLPLVLGRFTRLAQFFNDSAKVYEGEIRFGFSTDTYDAEGEAVGPVSSAQPTLGEIHRHLPALTGRILQLPPAYSAKKINGVAAYKLARKDKPVEMKAVEVIVHRFEIQSVWADRARFRCRSVGRNLHPFARPRSGPGSGLRSTPFSTAPHPGGEFNLSQAVTLEELAKRIIPGLAETGLTVTLSEYPLSDAVTERESLEMRAIPAIAPVLPTCIRVRFWRVTLGYRLPEVVAAIRNGRSVNLPEFSDAPLVKVFAQSEAYLSRWCSELPGRCFNREWCSSAVMNRCRSELPAGLSLEATSAHPVRGGNSPTRPDAPGSPQPASLWLGRRGRPARSTSTPRTSPMCHPGWPISSRPVCGGPYQGDAVSLYHPDGIRETVEGFDLKASKINGLQLLCGIWH